MASFSSLFFVTTVDLTSASCAWEDGGGCENDVGGKDGGKCVNAGYDEGL